MEYALEIEKFDKKVLDKSISRIYFGDAFCQNLIPNKKVLLETYKKVIDIGKEFSFNTPFLNDDNINKELSNIECLYNYNKNFEIIVNDYGLLYEIRTKFPDIKLNLGRLLTKQKTDPNIIKKNKNTKTKDDIEKLLNKTLSKNRNIYKHFKSSMINDKLYQKYLLENNVNRLEIEYLIWDMNLSFNKKFKVTIYYPYAHITTTRNCGISNMSYTKCNKTCNDIKLEIKNHSHFFNYFLIRNTVYYNIEKFLTKDSIKKYNNIDRIVFNNIKNYKQFLYGEKNEY